MWILTYVDKSPTYPHTWITLRVTHNPHIITAVNFPKTLRHYERESPLSTKFGEEPQNILDLKGNFIAHNSKA